jgi:hypothetical protein
MADTPFMDEERHGEQARQDALWALRGQPIAPLPLDREVSPEEAVSAQFSKSPFGYIDRGLKAGTDWIKGRMAKRKAPFEKAGLTPTPIDPVELVGTMLTEGGRTANRWLAAAGGHGPMLRDEDLLGPLGMSAMGAPFAVGKTAAHLGSAGGKLPASATFTRQVDDLGYYSKLDEVLGSLRPTDTVTQDTLAKRGVKAAEIEARGLSPFFAEGKGAKVGELQSGAQPVQLRESRYQGERPWDDYTDAGRRPHYQRYMEGPPEGTKPAKWREWATDGDNPTYHEGVLHLPGKKPTFEEWYEKTHIKPLSEYPADSPLHQRFRDSYELEKDKMPLEGFRSGHWDEPNAIAHYRASMQPTEGGGKAYLIDELQSDWGQKLRDGGVRDEAKIGELRKRIEESKAAYEKHDDAGAKLLSDIEREGRTNMRLGVDESLGHKRLLHELLSAPQTPTDVKARIQSYFDQYKANGSNFDLLQAELRTAEAATPGNPFVNTTEQWMTTALRRIMRNAAEQQADGIAITPGAVHNERFGLEKHFRKVEYNPETQELLAHRADVSGDRPVATKVPPDKLAEHVGAETAERLLATKPDGEGYHALSGLDLRMGGEGMKYAYDKILPKLLGKELSKLDPSIKYGQKHLDYHHGKDWVDPNPFHHFPLTPKAREEIMKGLPLFNRADGSGAALPFEAMRAARELEAPLDMSQEARMARAKEMGFDTEKTYYHGSPVAFDEFKTPRRNKPTYFTDDPKIADIYAGTHHAQEGKPGYNPTIYPVHLRGSRLTVSDKGPDGSHGWISDNLKAALGVTDADLADVPLARRYSALFKIAKDRGYGMVEAKDFMDLGGPQTQYMVLDPSNIRSTQAAFDPAKADSANLLAANPGTEQIMELLRAQQQLQSPFTQDE